VAAVAAGLADAADLLRALDSELSAFNAAAARAAPARGQQQQAADYRRLLVAGLERHYGVSPLTGERQRGGEAVEARADAAGQLAEALGCLEAPPSRLLAKADGASLVVAAPGTAAAALAAHVFALAAAAAAGLMRAAVERLLMRDWLRAWADAAAGGLGGSAAEEAVGKQREVRPAGLGFLRALGL
jgi:hypothetical protein